MRHQGGINVGFLDGHTERRNKARFYDLDGKPARPSDKPQDVDPYGNRPFYAWGLSRWGRDFLR
jgi:prepilin-type processing-associated H-X9-DG protein